MQRMWKRIRTTAEFGYVWFFRARLLVLKPEQIGSYIDQLDKEAAQIREQSLRLTWYLRGGVTYDQVMNMSATERQMINVIAKDNIETTKKSGLPWF